MQITGFFIIESFVQRSADGLVSAADGAMLWASAARMLRSVLEAALPQLDSAAQLVMGKDYVTLVCAALERAGYQVRRAVCDVLIGCIMCSNTQRRQLTLPGATHLCCRCRIPYFAALHPHVCPL